MALPGAVRHFTRAAGDYSSFRSGLLLGWLQREEETAVRELAVAREGDLVLDAGCGAGTTLDWLRQAGTRAVGIDVVPSMVAACRHRAFAVAVQDLDQLALKPVFDWCLCIGALEFVADPKAAIASLASCLRPGGSMVLLFPHRSMLGYLYSAYHRSHGVRAHLFSESEISSWIRAAGLASPHGWRRCTLSTICVARLPTSSHGSA